MGGMAKALRTIPVILRIARRHARRSAPGALLVNFTNPAGLVTEALNRYAPRCPCGGGVQRGHHHQDAACWSGWREAGQKIDAGTRRAEHPGPQPPDLASAVSRWMAKRCGRISSRLTWTNCASEEHPEWDVRTLEVLGMIPNYYLQYFYYTDKKLEAQKKWPPSRAEEVMEIEEDLLREYADPALTEPPADLMKRGGAYYSTLATQLINSHYNDLGQVHVVNVRNNGAVEGWPADWVVEMPGQGGRKGHPPAAGQSPCRRPALRWWRR